jgi:hypothetical protein
MSSQVIANLWRISTSEKLESQSFCQFFIVLIEGWNFDIPYSSIFTDIIPANILRMYLVTL